ncbi:MAG: AMP-binding protein [Hahellaceae bacterium]|nr:AMP-binding protein [Hahellaceae bacterium]
MGLVEALTKRWHGVSHPFLIHENQAVAFSDLQSAELGVLDEVQAGDVVALIGDFEPLAIATLLHLIDRQAIVVPLTADTRTQHPQFFTAAQVDVVIEGASVRRIAHEHSHPLIQQLRVQQRAGLVLFSSGTTGQPKAILHDLSVFLKRFETPRPALKTLNFLLFDHIGGLNTLLHTLFNTGTVIALKTRTVESILEACVRHAVEVLPTTPTFLRMMLMSGLIPAHVPASLKIITYGTERMDQPTLDALCAALPEVDFRQTFGMSELGIVRVKSEARNSLFMQIGGEGVKTRVVDGVLEIYSETRMLGYLNAPNPFDNDGWYNTKDQVVTRNGFYKVTGRSSDLINVGGLKFMASEVERVALAYDGVALARAEGKSNPITGQHVELTVEPKGGQPLEPQPLKDYLNATLPAHMVPRRLKIGAIAVGHRFKRL